MRNLFGLGSLLFSAAAFAPLTAQSTAGSAVESVGPATKTARQSYTLTFVPTQSHVIVQAKLTLHGLAGAQVIPAGDTPRADATESFNVTPSAGANHLFHTTIYTEKLTGVRWVQLDELTYADGTTWYDSANTPCRIAPNGFTLVASGM